MWGNRVWLICWQRETWLLFQRFLVGKRFECLGTTRDAISVHLDIQGQSVILTDTAGLRKTENKIEIEGIKRSKLHLDQAQAVI
jgi:predicted GTPase